MDFTKFVWLLDSAALFFSRADRLGDPFEGSTSRENIRLRPEVYSDALERVSREPPPGMLVQLPDLARSLPARTFVNCWHMNEYESAAMWKLYARTNEAIAIQTRFLKLFNSLPEKTYVGLVKYIDYDKDWMPEGNTFYPFLHKRQSFSHEREVRAIQQYIPTEANPFPKSPPGIQVSINIPSIVDAVYVAPSAPTWFHELVGAVMKRYKLEIELHQSSLDEEPVY